MITEVKISAKLKVSLIFNALEAVSTVVKSSMISNCSDILGALEVVSAISSLYAQLETRRLKLDPFLIPSIYIMQERPNIK